MHMAKLVAAWSKDSDHKVGAVIVDQNNHVLGLGYNGPPKNVIDASLVREAEVMRSLHAELNAILNCNESLKGSTLFVYPFSPCAQCAAAMIQKGISRVMYFGESKLATWARSQKEALMMLTEANVKVERFMEEI